MGGMGALDLLNGPLRTPRWIAGTLIFNMGGGIEYFVTEQFAVGSSIMFNVMPESVIAETFVFSWQMGSARFLF